MSGYSIGQASKILQMPEQTLRFLEKKGLVSPQRDERNGYRYYSEIDIHRLVDYRWYRDAGYSLSDAIEAITDKDLFQFSARMKQAQGEAEREARAKVQLAKRLDLYQRKLDMEYLAANLGVCQIEQSPEMLFCMNAVTSDEGEQFKYADQFKGWFDVALEYYSFLDYIFIAYRDSVIDERMDFGVAMGYAMERTWADALGLDLPETAEAIPSAPSVHVMLRIPDSASISDTVRACVLPYLEETDLSLAGDVWGNRLAAIEEGGQMVMYTEVWAAVQPRDRQRAKVARPRDRVLRRCFSFVQYD